MKTAARLLLAFAMALGLLVGVGTTASASSEPPPPDCGGVWSVDHGPVTYWASGAWTGNIHTQVHVCDGISEYRAALFLGAPLPAGQWANAFLDVYKDGLYVRRFTCDDPYGTPGYHITPGRSYCTTRWWPALSSMTFVSQAYIYRVSDNQRIGSGRTDNCSRWVCL